MKIFNRLVSILLRVGTSVILLFFLFKFKDIDWRDLLQIIRNADKPLLVTAFFIFLLNYILSFFRWQMLLRAIQIKLPMKRIIVAFAGGVFFNLLMPSTIGGDFARSIDLSLHTKKAKEVVATVFLDRLSGYAGLVIVVLMSVFFGWDLIRHNSAVITSVVIITVLLIAILLVLFNSFLFSKVDKILYSPNAGKIREALINLQQEIYYFKRYKKVILGNILLSIAIQLITPLTCYIMALALGARLSAIYFFIFLPIIGAFTLLPISIGGLGIRENAMRILFSGVGMSQNLAVSMGLLNFIFILLCGIGGGFIYVLTVHHRRLQPSQ